MVCHIPFPFLTTLNHSLVIMLSHPLSLLNSPPPLSDWWYFVTPSFIFQVPLPKVFVIIFSHPLPFFKNPLQMDWKLHCHTPSTFPSISSKEISTDLPHPLSLANYPQLLFGDQVVTSTFPFIFPSPKRFVIFFLTPSAFKIIPNHLLVINLSHLFFLLTYS